MAVSLQPDVVAWARRANYSLTQHGDGETLELWSDPGGEQRFYVRQHEGGWWALSSTDRGSAERLELTGSSLMVVEKYLLALLGDAIREREGLRDLRIPNHIDSLPDGYSVDDPDADGFRRLKEGSSVVAKTRGRIIGKSTLVKTAHLLALPVQTIQDSYVAEDGAPLGAR